MSQPLLQDYLTESEFALELGVSKWTLRAWRKKRYGPPWGKLGAQVVYSRAGVRQFLEAQISEREA